MIPGTDSIIDLSHWNTVLDFDKVKQSGVSAVIHKCSQGLVMDPRYMSRNVDWTGLWGAYHFGVQSHDPVEQADFFMANAKRAKLLALDWEWNNADTMRADQAAAFVQRVFDKAGRWPMIYTSAAFIQSQQGWISASYGYGARPIELMNCDLWLTGFTNIPILPPHWKHWRIWQHGLGACPGIVGQVDRDTFNGTAEELAEYFG